MFITDNEFESVVFNGKKLNEKINFTRIALIYLETASCRSLMSNEIRLKSIKNTTIQFRKLLEEKHQLIDRLIELHQCSVNMNEL